MPVQLTWLLLEGVLPLMGAAVIYLLWGGFRYVAAMESAQFTYQWAAAADPLGWLYGALIIAVQSAVKSFSAPSRHEFLAWACIIGAILCLVLLLAAMTERGAVSEWKPPRRLHRYALALVGVILFFGYWAHIPLPSAAP
jgi:hypothetical protein